jgi:uracil-DNA glycosylase
MPATGEGRKKILVVAEAPGQTEDERGEQLIGDAGQLLRRHLRKFDVDLDRDCWKTNACICRPKNNVTPTNAQIEACRPNVLRAIKEFRPRTIILLGASAVRSAIGHCWREDPGAIGRWVGWTIPHREWNAWICPTWHPSYLKRTENRKGEGELLSMFFDRHLEAAVSFKKRPWKTPPRRDIRLIVEPSLAARDIEIQTAGCPKSIAFDYETNMLKPDSDEAEIVSCAICWDGKETTAFPWHGPVIPAMKALLRSSIPKVGANIKFEDRWTRAKLRCRVKNWQWDTMLAAHVLDNRTGITGLKFQAFVQLGQESYDNTVAPFLKAKGKSHVNRIRDVPLRELLTYNALDSALEWELAQVQMRQMGFQTTEEET